MASRKSVLQATIVGSLLLITAILLANVCWVLFTAGDRPLVNDFRMQVLAALFAALGALVTAELGLAPAGQRPGQRYSAKRDQPDRREVLVWAGCAVWLLGGLALLVACLYQDAALPKATAIAQGWLGTAVAALYAYFGLPKPVSPSKREPQPDSDAP